MKNIFVSFLNVLTTTLLLGVVALFLIPLLPIPGNVEIKIVKSGSMEPTIATGGIVVIKPEASYAVGDVVTFGEDTKTEIPTTHRIIDARTENRETIFTTMGDANEEQDPQPVREREVIGKVIFTAPYVGYLLDFSRQPLGFALFVGIPAVTIILNEILAIVREVRKGRRKKKGIDESRHPEKPKRKDEDLLYEEREVTLNTPMYVRERRMDDISLPVDTIRVLQPRQYRRGIDGIIATCLISAGAAGAFGVALSHVGSTVSYYRNTESSLENMLSAAALNFSLIFAILPDSTITLDVTEGDEEGTSIIPQLMIDLPSNDPEYRVHVEKIEGDEPFCSKLFVEGSGLFPFPAQEFLTLPEQGPTTDTTPWTLTFTLPDATDVNEEDECMVDLVYTGKISGGDNAYNDEERIHLLLRAHVLVPEIQFQALSLPQEEEVLDEPQGEPEDPPEDVPEVDEEDPPQDPPQDLPQDVPQDPEEGEGE